MAQGDLRYKSALFGDDYFATVYDESIPKKNSRGIEMKKYLLVPTPDLVDAYPYLKQTGVLNINTRIGPGLWREYPTYWINDENPSRTHAIARIYCSFDGGETAETRRVAKLTAKINQLQIENEQFRIANIVDNEEKLEMVDERLKFLQRLAEGHEILKGDAHAEENETEQEENK